MAKVVVNRENFKVDEIELEQGTLTVGRSDKNDLHIDDLTVSGRHAKIVTVFGSTYVEDLGSTNGTYVNGKKVKTHTLHNGDVLTIGHYQLLFQGEAVDNPRADSDQTRMINQSQVEALTKTAGSKHRQQAGRDARQKPAAAASRPAAAPRPASAPRPVAAKVEKGPVPVDSGRVVSMSTAKPLPDIDDSAVMIDTTAAQPMVDQPQEKKMKPMRRGDVSPSTSLKTIVLAALTAAATFMLMMLIFDL